MLQTQCPPVPVEIYIQFCELLLPLTKQPVCRWKRPRDAEIYAGNSPGEGMGTQGPP